MGLKDNQKDNQKDNHHSTSNNDTPIARFVKSSPSWREGGGLSRNVTDFRMSIEETAYSDRGSCERVMAIPAFFLCHLGCEASPSKPI